MHPEDHAANRRFGEEHHSLQCPDPHCEGHLVLVSDGHWYCHGMTHLAEADVPGPHRHTNDPSAPHHRQAGWADDDEAWHSVCRISDLT